MAALATVGIMGATYGAPTVGTMAGAAASAAVMDLAVIGVGLSALGMVQQGQAAAQQAKSEQAMAEYNAKVAQQEAKAKEQRGLFEQRRQTQAAERQGSSLLAGLGASGVQTQTGAPLLIQTTQAQESELDNALIGYNSMIDASRSRSQATLYSMEASAAGTRGRNAATAGYIGAGTTLLKGFGALSQRTA